MMKTVWLRLACLAACLHLASAAAADSNVRGDRRVVTGSGIQGEKTVSLPGGVARLVLDVPGTVTVRLEAKSSPRVRIRVDRNLLEMIAVETVGAGTKITSSGSFRAMLPLQIDVVLNRIESLSAAGSADVVVEQLNEPRFALDVPGSGSVRLAAGRVEKLTLRLDGSGDLTATGLNASGCEVSASGAANAAVRCTDSISGNIAGAGEWVVAGKPKRRAVRASEAAEIRFE